MKKVNFLFRLKFILLTFLFSNFLNAQYTNLPLGYNFNLNLGVEIDQNIQNTSFKPIIIGSQILILNQYWNKIFSLTITY